MHYIDILILIFLIYIYHATLYIYNIININAYPYSMLWSLFACIYLYFYSYTGQSFSLPDLETFQTTFKLLPTPLLRNHGGHRLNTQCYHVDECLEANLGKVTLLYMCTTNICTSIIYILSHYFLRHAPTLLTLLLSCTPYHIHVDMQYLIGTGQGLPTTFVYELDMSVSSFTLFLIALNSDPDPPKVGTVSQYMYIVCIYIRIVCRFLASFWQTVVCMVTL